MSRVHAGAGRPAGAPRGRPREAGEAAAPGGGQGAARGADAAEPGAGQAGGGAEPHEDVSFGDTVDLLLDSLGDLYGGFVRHLPLLGIAVLVLLATWGVSWAAQKAYWRVVQRRTLRPSLKALLSKLLAVGVWAAGALVAAMVVFPSLELGGVLAGLGLTSIALGFAFKDVVENFLAGFVILLREQMEIGDYVLCEGIEGQVERITIRDTLIRQTDGQCVVMPNSMLFKNPVTIRTDLPLRRTTVICGVAYGEDVDRARAVIKAAVEALPSVEKDREVQIFAQAFGESSIDFEVTWWTGSKPVDVRRSRDEVVAAVKRGLDEAGIEIPFPYRTLTFKEPLDLQQRADEDA